MNQASARSSRPLWLPALLAVACLALSLPAFGTDQRNLSKSFPLPASGALRIANLAGHVELLPGGREVKVEATVFADGKSAAQTRELLDGMEWVETSDQKGNPEWALSYPVGDFRGFAYPQPGRAGSEPSFWESLFAGLDLGSQSNGYLLGKRVSVYGSSGPSVPVLYADLKITLPARAKLVVRNLVGAVKGGTLEGDLTVDTGSGGVAVDGFSGTLYVDTGSGNVKLGSVRGETRVDTGSGDIDIRELIGNGSLDTGSGDVEVAKVAAGKLDVDTGSGNILVANGSVATLSGDTGSGDIEVRGVEVETFEGDTGSGNVTLVSSLAEAREIRIDTGSGDVEILGGPAASFDLEASQGSGDLNCRYADATLRKRGHEVVGAERGDRKTRIVVETGSGDCTIAPQA